MGTGCQVEGEHKSSSIQKPDSQPVEEVLEPNSTPGDPRTPAFLPQSPHNLPSRVGNGYPDGSTASMAAPATRRGSVRSIWLGSLGAAAVRGRGRGSTGRLFTPQRASISTKWPKIFSFFYRNYYKKLVLSRESLKKYSCNITVLH